MHQARITPASGLIDLSRKLKLQLIMKGEIYFKKHRHVFMFTNLLHSYNQYISLTSGEFLILISVISAN